MQRYSTTHIIIFTHFMYFDIYQKIECSTYFDICLKKCILNVIFIFHIHTHLRYCPKYTCICAYARVMFT